MKSLFLFCILITVLCCCANAKTAKKHIVNKKIKRNDNNLVNLETRDTETSSECKYINSLFNKTKTYNCCQKEGVYCSNGNIIAIELINKKLQSPIPKNIGKLSKLRDLKLQNNTLSGSIPESIGNLSNLEVLYLCNNNLEGSIPETFKKIN